MDTMRRSTLSTQPSLYAETLECLFTLHSHPGWKAQAWHRAKELEACPTHLWVGITTDLIDRMKAQFDNQSK
jgi:hypothetical protein